MQSGVEVQAKKTEDKLKVKQKKITLTVGQKRKIKVTAKKKLLKKLVWKSSNQKVATVSKKGVVKAKKKGQAKITVSVKKNKKIKVSFTVKVKEKKKETAEEKVVTPATTGAINVTGTAIFLSCYSQGTEKKNNWFYDAESMQTLYSSINYDGDIGRNNMLNQIAKYDTAFFQNKAIYFDLLESSSTPHNYYIKSAVVKQNENGEWVCEVNIKVEYVNYEGVLHMGMVEHDGLFLEFDKNQIEGVSKVEIIKERTDIYLPAPTSTPSAV